MGGKLIRLWLLLCVAVLLHGTASAAPLSSCDPAYTPAPSCLKLYYLFDQWYVTWWVIWDKPYRMEVLSNGVSVFRVQQPDAPFQTSARYTLSLPSEVVGSTLTVAVAYAADGPEYTASMDWPRIGPDPYQTEEPYASSEPYPPPEQPFSAVFTSYLPAVVSTADTTPG